MLAYATPCMKSQVGTEVWGLRCDLAVHSLASAF